MHHRPCRARDHRPSGLDRIVLSFASLSAAAIAATALAAASKPAAANIATTLAPPIAAALASPIATTLASPIAAALASTAPVAPVAPSLAAKTSRAAPTSHAARPKCGQLQKLPTDKSRLLLASGRVRSHQSQPLRPLRDGEFKPRGGRIHRPQQSNLLDAGQLRHSGAQPVLRCGHCASNATSFASSAPLPTYAPEPAACAEPAAAEPASASAPATCVQQCLYSAWMGQ